MNRFLGDHQALVRSTVIRAMESLQTGYEFGILGFQEQDSGPTFYRWPADGSLLPMDDRNRSRAKQFLTSLDGKFQGSSSLINAFDEAFKTDAESIILFSDGLPNPNYNRNLSPGRLVRSITVSNNKSREIHAGNGGRLLQIPWHSGIHGIAGPGQRGQLPRVIRLALNHPGRLARKTYRCRLSPGEIHQARH